MTTYVRTLGGTKVHYSGCHYATNSVPWIWAEGMTPKVADEHAASKGIKLQWCRRCFPGWYE